MKKKKINADAALLEVARRHHTTVEEVRKEIPKTLHDCRDAITSLPLTRRDGAQRDTLHAVIRSRPGDQPHIAKRATPQ